MYDAQRPRLRPASRPAAKRGSLVEEVVGKLRQLVRKDGLARAVQGAGDRVKPKPNSRRATEFAAVNPMRLIDLSHPLVDSAPAFPNDPTLAVVEFGRIATHRYNISRVFMGFPLNFRGRDGSPIRAVAMC
jgi:hypothetical protein